MKVVRRLDIFGEECGVRIEEAGLETKGHERLEADHNGVRIIAKEEGIVGKSLVSTFGPNATLRSGGKRSDKVPSRRAAEDSAFSVSWKRNILTSGSVAVELRAAAYAESDSPEPQRSMRCESVYLGTSSAASCHELELPLLLSPSALRPVLALSGLGSSRYSGGWVGSASSSPKKSS